LESVFHWFFFLVFFHYHFTDSVGSIRSFTGFFFISLLHFSCIYYFSTFPSLFFPDRALGIPTSARDGPDALGIFLPFKHFFVCMYLCKYRGSYWGARRSRVVWISFPPSRVYFSFVIGFGLFSFFIQTGFLRRLAYKACLFFLFSPSYFFIFAFSPPKHLLDIAPLFFPSFFRLAVGSFPRERERKKRDVMDGWTEGGGGRAGRNRGGVPFLSSGNE